MRIKVLGPLSSAKFRSTFVAEMRFMHGDGDAYTTEEFAIPSFDELHDLINFRRAWFALSHRDKFRLTDRRDDGALVGLEGFGGVFGTLEKWPLDETTVELGLERLAGFVSCEIFYYDVLGVKHNVEITED